MKTAVALGSNLGDRIENLRAARQQITALADVQPPIVSSALYETEPIDCEPGAAKFLNAVIEFDYKGDPIHLLEHLVRIEESLGRSRDHGKNISRNIDLDLLYCGDLQIDTGRLQLPHPRTHLRRFVLRPLADLHAKLVLPGRKKTIEQLLAELQEPREAVQLTKNW
jgi:2-amino-4-hydroxy-6-hydroxymethyldihydropteridine diphosphokinase